MKNKLFWPVVGGVFLVLVLFVWSQNIRQGQNPITAFRTSLIEIGDTVEGEILTEEGLEGASLLEMVAHSLASIESKLDQGVRVKENREFPLAVGKKMGEEEEKDYIIPGNTCQNGVRLVLKIDPLSIAQDKTPVVTVLGVNHKKNRATFAKEVEFTKKKSFHIFHLPSVLLEDNDSVFPEYKISEGLHAENVVFDVFCY